MNPNFTPARTLLALLLTCSVLLTYAQNVNIPDANFKAALVANHAINTNSDSEIQLSEAAAFTGTMRVSNKNISNLAGIEAFTALTALWCDNNNLASLDVSANTALTTLRCNHNHLTALDVSHNTQLTDLRCYVNQIAGIDVSANAMLSVLLIFQNKLTALDVSSNAALTQLQASFNQLSNLDVSSNHQLTSLDVRKNFLTMLNVKNGNNMAFNNFDARENPQLFCIQVDDAAWSEAHWTQIGNGAYFSTDCVGSQNDVVNIPDANFKSYLVANNAINTNHDSEIQVSEAGAYTGAIKVANKNISDLTGIEAFTKLTILECNNNNLTSLNVSSNTKLTALRCDHNSISSLNVSSNAALRDLRCYYNQLTGLNVTSNNELNTLMCFGNQLTSLDVTANWQLTNLQCNHNQLTSLTIGIDNNIQTLYAHANKLTSLNLTDARALRSLRVNLNKLTALDISSSTALETLIAGDNLITSLNLHNNVNLTSIRVYNNKLASLSLRTNIHVTDFYAEKNPLTALDVKNGHNTAITYFNTLHTPQLFCIEVDDPAWAETHWTLVDPASSFSADCNPSENVVYIPDVNFKNYLLSRPDINTNGDNEIQVTEASAPIEYISAVGYNINDLTGIEAFTGLTKLFIGDNNLTTLDLSHNAALTQAFCEINHLTSLVLGTNPNLTMVVCSDNSLSSIDVSGLPALDNLEVDGNQLTSIDVSHNPALTYLGATTNKLEMLDVSANTHLRSLGARVNHLTYLNVKNGNNTAMTHFNADQNPDLHCIQVDDPAYSQAHWGGDVNSGVTFSTDCNYDQDDVVYIPDPLFKQRVLMDPDINTNGDDEIQVTEAEAFTGFLNLDATGMSDQTGLEAFINITALDIQHSNMTSLDVSANVDLRYVDCGQNQITTLKINPGLRTLYCYYNQITNIDLNGNNNLRYFDATDNKLASLDLSSLDTTVWVLSVDMNPITSLDVSQLTHLSVLAAGYTQLTSLDLNSNTGLEGLAASHNPELVSIKVKNGNNTHMQFNAQQSPKLRCIEVDDVAYAEAHFYKDATAYFSANCGNAGGEIVYIPDANLKNYLVADFIINTNRDSEIQVSEAQYGGTPGSNWNTLAVSNKDVFDATGIEAFSNIRFLFMNGNHIQTIDVRPMTGLKGLDVTDNDLVSVQFGPGLESLTVDKNELTTLDLSNAPALLALNYSYNNMEPLDLNQVPQLRDLGCAGTGLVNLNVSMLPNLFNLGCGDNELASLDLSANTQLSGLGVANNHLSGLDLSHNLELQWLNISGNPITALNVNHLTHMYAITANNTPLTSLDLGNMLELQEVNVEHNHLTQLNTVGSYNMLYLYAGFNQLETFIPGGILDVLTLNDNHLTSLDMSGYEGHEYYFWNMHNNPDLHCVEVDDVQFANDYWTSFFDEGVSFSTDCQNNGVVYIPDANLKSYLLSQPSINTNGDTEIQVIEAQACDEILFLDNKNISDATGLEAFVNVPNMGLTGNNLTSLDVSQNSALKTLNAGGNELTSLVLSPSLLELRCGNNSLTSLDLSAAPGLTWLEYPNNPIGTMDFSSLPALQHLDCAATGATSVNVSTNTNLVLLWCSNNQLTNIDLSANVNLNSLDIDGNQLTSLNLSANPEMAYLACRNNNFTTLDVSSLTHLYFVLCSGNQLTSFDVSNKAELTEVDVSHNMLTELNIQGAYRLESLHAGFNALTTLIPGGAPFDLLELNNNQLTSLDLSFYEFHDYLSMDMHNNPDLHCVDVNDVQYAEDNWSRYFDAGVSFSTDCGGSNPGGRLSISTYPNPVIDKVTIESTEPIEVVHIFDQSGARLIDTQQGNSIDFSGFQKGIYVMHVHHGGKRTPVRVVKD